MSLAQNKEVVPPVPTDTSLRNFTSIVQKNLLDLHQAAHIHKIVTEDPATNDGAIGDIYIVQSGAGTYLTVKVKTGWVKQTDGIVRVDDFGAYGDGVHDDSAAIQAALDFISKSGISAVLLFSSKTYKCNAGLKVNMSLVSMQGNCCTLDFSGLTSGVAVTIAGSDAHWYAGNPFIQADKEMAQFTLVGNAFGGSVTAIWFTTSNGNGTGASHITIRSCDIHDFNIGLLYGDGAYLIKIDNTDIWHCVTAVSMPAASIDAGENNTFNECALYNSSNGLVMDSVNADVAFYNCSIDGMDTTYVSVTSGSLTMYTPHFEGNFGTGQPTNPKFITNPAGGSRSSITIFNPEIIVKQAQVGDNLAVPIIGIYGNTSFHLYSGTGILSGGAFVAPATGAIESLTGSVDLLVLNFNWEASANLYGTLSAGCTTTLNAYNSSDFSTSKGVTAASYGVGNNKQTWGAAAPTTGVHQQGDIVWKIGALSGGFAGFICVAAGTPGTWKTFGAIS